MKRRLIALSLILSLLSCSESEQVSKFEDPSAQVFTLEPGERLRDFTFMNGGELYIRTTIDSTPPETHYIQRYVNFSFRVKLIIQEQ